MKKNEARIDSKKNVYNMPNYNVTKKTADMSNSTILCVDIVQSTKEISSMDVEEAREWVESAINLMIHAVRRYGGTIKEFTGDGVIAVFNIKDHQLRSCLAALLLQSLLLSMERPHHSRVGLYNGGIKSSSKTKLWTETKYMTMAQKLQDFAPIDKVLVTDIMKQEIGELLQLGEVEHITVEGEPLNVYPLLNISTQGKAYMGQIPDIAIVVDKSNKAMSQKLEGERKYVTNLFIRFSGKNRQALQQATKICAELASKFEGLLLKRSGGILYVIFGAPISLEDHPLRGCLTAYALLEKIKEMELPVDIQAGINSGEVLMDLIGGQEFQSYDSIGIAVNLAARMMQTAAKNQIQLNKATFDAVKPYITYTALGQKYIKGFFEEVTCYALTGIRSESIHGHMEMSLYERTPYFGREEEKEIFSKKLEKTFHHEGQTLGLCSVPGLGKSRLAYEFQKIAKEKNVSVYTTTSSVYDSKITFSTLKLLLESLFHINTEDEPEKQIEFLRNQLGKFHFTEKFFLESLLTILGVDMKTPGWAGASAVFQKRVLLTSVTEYLEELSYDKPIMIIMDDVQWCDEETLTFLKNTLPILKTHAILLILNHRSDFDFEHYFETMVDIINLKPLDDNSCKNLVENLLPGKDSIVRAREKIVKLSEGNPFMIQEYTDMLIDNEEIVKNKDGTYSPTSKIKLNEMPLSVRGIFTSRIDHLSKDEKRLLLQASILGKTFSVSFLNYINDAEEIEFKETLNGLLKKGFIHELTPLPEPQYTFMHSSICEVAYDTVLKKDRQKYHQTLVKKIEEYKHDDLKKYYYTLAHHCNAGALWAKAINYYNLIIPSEPIITFTADQFLIMPLKAKECFEHLALNEKKEIFTHYGRTQLMYVYGLLMCGDIENMMAVIETVKEDAQQFNNKLIEAMSEVWIVMSSSMLGACSPVLPLCERVATLKNELKEIIAPKDFEIVALDMELAPLHLAWPLGDYALFDKSFEIYEKSRLPMTALSRYLGSAPITIAFLHHAFYQLNRADIKGMRKHIPRVINTLKSDLGVSETSIGLNACIGLYKFSIGNFKKAEKIFENTLTMAEDLNFGSVTIMLQPYLIISLVYNGKIEEAKGRLEILLGILTAMYFSAMPSITLHTADAAIALKDWEKAWEVINNIQPIVEADNEKPAIAHCYRLRAQLLDLTDPQHTHDEEILHLLSEAKNITEEIGCYVENPHIELALAEFYKNRDQMEKYHHHYELALAYFKEYKMIGWYKYHKAQLVK